MSTHQACKGLGLAISVIINHRRQCTSLPGPIVEGYQIEVLIEGGSRLFIDNSENLINCCPPYTMGQAR